MSLTPRLFGAITVLCIICLIHFQSCLSQRNPPQGVSSSSGDPNLYTYGRGDIPIFNPGDPHGALLASLRKLIEAIRLTESKVKLERNATVTLRKALEDCKACQIKSPECSDDPPICFPEVECVDTYDGPVCGPCPPGWCGDGRHCERCLCNENPCYPGVSCAESDIAPFFRCGLCPEDYTGNGITCRKLPCQHSPYPCYEGVECFNLDCPPFFRCGPCPAGFTGNGTFCVDVDECDVANPCFDEQSCQNTVPGFRCGACPSGYTGSHGIQGLSVKQPKQECVDIDECAVNNGDCARHSGCFNTIGSFHCGECDSGYDGNQQVGCWPSFCPAN